MTLVYLYRKGQIRSQSFLVDISTRRIVEALQHQPFGGRFLQSRHGARTSHAVHHPTDGTGSHTADGPRARHRFLLQCASTAEFAVAVLVSGAASWIHRRAATTTTTTAAAVTTPPRCTRWHRGGDAATRRVLLAHRLADARVSDDKALPPPMCRRVYRIDVPES